MIIIKYFKNIVFIFKLKNITDFSFVTNAVVDVCKIVVDKISETTTTQDMENYCSEIKAGIIETVKEKNVNIEYSILRLKDENMYFNIYKHKYLHGKENQHTCEKACIFVNNEILDQETLLDISMEVIGFKYSNLLIEELSIERSGSFNPLTLGKNIPASGESYFEIIKILSEKSDIKMIYVI